MSEIGKTEKLPCIFGPEIYKDCPVRRELRRPDISKWIKPETVTEIEEVIERLSGAIVDAIETEFSTLSDFCSCCPFLAKKISSYEE